MAYYPKRLHFNIVGGALFYLQQMILFLKGERINAKHLRALREFGFKYCRYAQDSLNLSETGT